MKQSSTFGRLLALSAVWLMAGRARAQDFDARGFLEQHAASYEVWEKGTKIAEATWDSLPSGPGATTLPALQDILVDKVNVVQPLVRESAPQNATQIQKADFQKQKDDKIDAVLSPLVGEIVTAQFKVDDVMDARQFETASGKGLHLDPNLGQYLVIGHFEPRAPAARVPMGRNQVGNQNQPAGSAFFHLGYIFSGDPEISKWRVGDSHAVDGVIQKVGMLISIRGAAPGTFEIDPRFQPFETVQMKLVVKAFNGPEPKLSTAKPATVPATKPTPTTRPAGKITIIGGRSAGSVYGQ